MLVQAVRSYQDAVPIVFFLGQLRLFSTLRRLSPSRFSASTGHAKPLKWWDSSTGRSGYQHGFEAGNWYCEVALTGELAAVLPSLAAQVEQEVRRIEGKFSRYGGTSVILALNQNAGRQAVAVDVETDGLLDLVYQQWQYSEGLVDATSGVARYAWDEGQLEAPYDPRELQHLLTCMGWKHVRRMPGWVRFEHPALEIDLGSLHEAFAVDRAVARVLAVEGVGVSLRVGHARRVAGTIGSTALTARRRPCKRVHLRPCWPRGHCARGAWWPKVWRLIGGRRTKGANWNLIRQPGDPCKPGIRW